GPVERPPRPGHPDPPRAPPPAGTRRPPRLRPRTQPGRTPLDRPQVAPAGQLRPGRRRRPRPTDPTDPPSHHPTPTPPPVLLAGRPAPRTLGISFLTVSSLRAAVFQNAAPADCNRGAAKSSTLLPSSRYTVRWFRNILSTSQPYRRCSKWVCRPTTKSRS